MKPLQPLPPLAVEVRHLLPADLPVHLVGGAVRDWFLQRPVVDLDFVLPKDALHWARQVARHLNAAYFPLDRARGIARVLLETPQGVRILDFADYRAPTLEEDLRLRDFTINALALDPLYPDRLVDPTRGLQDLLDKRIRACTPHAFADDPVRVVRAVRLALDLDFHIEPETQKAMRKAVPLLSRVSVERLRDEIFRVFGLRKVSAALRLLARLGALDFALPEAAAMPGVPLPPRYGQDDLWEHSLHTLDRLQDLLDALLPPYDPDKVANVHLAQVSWRLGRYRQRLAEYLRASLAGFRPRRALLVLATLYHDVGKIRLPHHPDPEAHARGGAVRMAERARALRLARAEVRWLRRVVRWHMWPQRFPADLPRPLDLYRFYREAGDAGVAVGLVHLANVAAREGLHLERALWEHEVDVVRRMWEAWWEHRDDWVTPRPLLSGESLIRDFGLTPGPVVGHLLEALKEAQVVGQVTTPDQARAWVADWLQKQGAAYGKISSSNGS